MNAKILSGTDLAKKIKSELKITVEEMKSKGINPCLAVVIVGNDPASRSYVDFKKKDCAEIGIESIEYALEEKTSEEELINLIHKMNN
ncbi:MAG: bifunctional 5,10-methylene-tetrahydrofolate dehydrogenase/5,10-methylene-tetrahydrofolate cyclohydrolase, partial [Oscillospiraceae bacterium]|nr:bifunctional 5,10-methylene-tetrahydrofolate dehydrogenase/5,10-methylene-tetrahydrofolate cyclohydrolase [Oscillospiraceae bacterium]